MSFSDIWYSVKSTFSVENQWLNYLIKLGFSAARSDGPANDNEKETLVFHAKDWLNNKTMNDNLSHLLKMGEDSNMGPEENVHIFLQVAKPPKVWFASMHYLLSVMLADGQLNESEAQWLLRFGAASKVDESYLRDIVSYFSGRENWREHGTDAYQLLGVSPEADPETIRKAYWQRAAEYHPDKLAGVNEAVKRLAEEKLKEINQAYERVTSVDNPPSIVSQLAVVDGSSAWNLVENMQPGEVATCTHCLQKNRLPNKNKFYLAKCGACHAYLALTEAQAALVCHLNGATFDNSIWHQPG